MKSDVHKPRAVLAMPAAMNANSVDREKTDNEGS